MDPETVFDVATHDAVTSVAVQKGLAEGYYPSYEDDVIPARQTQWDLEPLDGRTR